MYKRLIAILMVMLLIPSTMTYAKTIEVGNAKVNYYKNSKNTATYKYKSGSKITLYTGMYNGKGGKARYYAAHIQLSPRDYKKFSIAKANGKRSNGFQSVYSAVKSKKNKAYRAILAVNGAFNGKNSKHWVKVGGKWYGINWHDYHEIVGGKYYKGTIGSDKVTDCATYCRKTGILASGLKQKGVTPGMKLSTAAKKKYISETFSGDMGFTLLSNRKIVVKADNYYRQRTFIGTNGKAGDLWIVVCNGQDSKGHRRDKSSKGLNMYGCAKILKNLGCIYGYNLDGGGSTTMVFKGKVVTENWLGHGRPCYDMVYVGR